VQAIGGVGGRQELVIPVHCYPASTSFRFPRHIDFGTMRVGSSKKRSFKLAVDIPVEFEFTISVSQKHSDFHVSPLTGTIPGNGAVDINVVFEPCSLQTHRIELTLTSSHFKSEPSKCTLLGTVKAGGGRDEMIRAYTGDLPVSMTVLDSDHLLQEASRKLYPTSAKGGAGHGDPATEAAWKQRQNLSRSNDAVWLKHIHMLGPCEILII
jgi:Abnormal spindle-like microcephaly-assoc'd, ASPM-SPD-2-Hydin